MTWTLVKGHKGPVKGLRASRPQGLDPLFTDIPSAHIFLRTQHRGNIDSRGCVGHIVFYGTVRNKP
jgi:hypothetical protein